MDLDQLRTKMTSEEINALPLVHYTGPIAVVRSARELEEALPDICSEPILGFDTETRPSFRKGHTNLPSLLQIATQNRVYLFQLSRVPLGEDLAGVLSNPLQTKAGVGVDEDMRELGQLHAFRPAGQVDLGHVARSHRIWSEGLRSLTANFFHERISKGPQCSNWSVPNLTSRQVVYAATDAWIGRRIFLRMRELGLIGGR